MIATPEMLGASHNTTAPLSAPDSWQAINRVRSTCPPTNENKLNFQPLFFLYTFYKKLKKKKKKKVEKRQL